MVVEADPFLPLNRGFVFRSFSTFNETMLALLTASESTASSHLNLAEKLTLQVSDALKEKERRKEVIRTRVSSFPFLPSFSNSLRELIASSVAVLILLRRSDQSKGRLLLRSDEGK